MSSITYTDFRLPRKSMPIEEYTKDLDPAILQSGTSVEDLLSILKYSMGVEKVYLENKKDEAQIFSDLVKGYFDKSSTLPEEINYIIYTRGDSISVGNPWTLDEKETCINTPYTIQDTFKLINAEVINVEQECCGTIMAIKVADALLRKNEKSKILILTQNFFGGAEKRFMGGMILVSDGLGIMEISGSAGEGLEIIDYADATDGSISKVIELSDVDNAMYVFEKGAQLIRDVLKRNDLVIEDVSLIVPQNISVGSWNYYSQILPFPKNKVYLDNISDGGHMGDVDIIRNLTSVDKRKIIQRGNYVVIYGVSTGTSWNVILLKKI